MPSVGPSYPGTAVDEHTYGMQEWTTPENVKDVDETDYAQVQSDISRVSHCLRCTNFGFSVPTAATVKGIEVTMHGYGYDDYPNNYPYDIWQFIVKDDVIKTDVNKANATHWEYEPHETRVYGGPTDLWGQTWTPADINLSTFGFSYNVGLFVSSTLAYLCLFWVTVTVYYAQGVTFSSVSSCKFDGVTVTKYDGVS
jgi:hypothetical protein